MNDLKPKQEKFLAALMNTSSIEEAMAEAKLSRSTAFRYLRDPIFNEAYLTIRRENMQQVTATLQSAAQEAVATLREVMGDEEATSSARVQAARAVLDNAYKGLELDDVVQRLAKLEERIQ